VGVEYKAERGLLSEQEMGPVEQSHFPLLETLPRAEVQELARWLRSQRARARDIISTRRRVRRGKAEARGVGDGAASERGLSAKKQIFARALRRVNGRLEALLAEEKREQNLARLRDALARKQAAAPHHPAPGATARGGMRPKAGGSRPGIIQGGRIGSTSQAGRNAQARRDARG
jgi:hypothetical protein